jgi:hypothetical protein
VKLCHTCKGEGCWSDYPGNWYPCETCGEVGAVNDDGSHIRYTGDEDKWLSEDELVSLGKEPSKPKSQEPGCAAKSLPIAASPTDKLPIAISDQPAS